MTRKQKLKILVRIEGEEVSMKSYSSLTIQFDNRGQYNKLIKLIEKAKKYGGKLGHFSRYNLYSTGHWNRLNIDF